MSASVLPAFPCPCCDARAFHKRPVACAAESPDVVQSMAHLYLCHACGENYLATVQVERDGTRTETWDYYVDRALAMRRVRRYEPAGAFALAEAAPLFVLAGEAVSETAWRAALDGARAETAPLPEAAPDALIGRWRALWTRPLAEEVPAPLRLVLTSDFAAAQRRSA